MEGGGGGGGMRGLVLATGILVNRMTLGYHPPPPSSLPSHLPLLFVSREPLSLTRGTSALPMLRYMLFPGCRLDWYKRVGGGGG
jgi:hypothetical protein